MRGNDNGEKTKAAKQLLQLNQQSYFDRMYCDLERREIYQITVFKIIQDFSLSSK